MSDFHSNFGGAGGRGGTPWSLKNLKDLSQDLVGSPRHALNPYRVGADLKASPLPPAPPIFTPKSDQNSNQQKVQNFNTKVTLKISKI